MQSALETYGIILDPISECQVPFKKWYLMFDSLQPNQHTSVSIICLVTCYEGAAHMILDSSPPMLVHK